MPLIVVSDAVDLCNAVRRSINIDLCEKQFDCTLIDGLELSAHCAARDAKRRRRQTARLSALARHATFHAQVGKSRRKRIVFNTGTHGKL
jgi:hypothetical protein